MLYCNVHRRMQINTKLHFPCHQFPNLIISKLIDLVIMHINYMVDGFDAIICGIITGIWCQGIVSKGYCIAL